MLLFSKMDSVTESTKLVYNRIQQLEPEFMRNVIGCLLQQGHSAEELAQLAYGPDNLIQEVMHKAKANLQQLAIKPAVPSISPSLNSDNCPVSDFASQFTSLSHISSLTSTTFGDAGPYRGRQVINNHGLDSMSLGFSNPVNQLNNQTRLLGIEDQEDCISSGMSRFCYSNAELSNLHIRESHRFSGLSEYPVKPCHFFNKGICKHGSNCRYFHGDVMSDNVFDPNRIDFANEDQVTSPGSLQELELEIVEILLSRRGSPVSIASLPTIYYDKYGKVLQAEGYLTESQRHGKAGYSLTRLLARLRSSIRLIDRPHGQHAIILAADAPRYLENHNGRNDPGPIVNGSRQIYMTFPAESTFSDDDVSNYFNTFGQVEDVRIPCQDERMFGFVSFASADTVRTILAKGNPHFVRGSRVLVKPYREKAKPLERKYSERRDSLPYHFKYHTRIDPDYPSMTRGFESPRMLKKRLKEEPVFAFDFERMHLARLNLAQETLANQSQFGYSMDELQVPELLNHIIDNVLDDVSASDEKEGRTNSNSSQESQALTLPGNPFASTTASSISADIEIGQHEGNAVDRAA